MLKLCIKPLIELNHSYNERANHHDDAGCDLYIQHYHVCEPHKVTFIHHHIACEMLELTSSLHIPVGDETYETKEFFKNLSYLLVPRSSISKTPLLMANSIGIIDTGYRGEIIAAVYNTSSEPYIIDAGTRLFQIIAPNLQTFDVEIVNELSETKRGTGGFGSTGA